MENTEVAFRNALEAEVMNMNGAAGNYVHAVNKTTIPTVNIMGAEIAAINMNWLLNFTERYIKVLSGDYICVSNVHTVVTSFEDPEYCAITNGGIMAIPDGGPLSTIGRKRGFREMERVTGPNYMGEILKISSKIPTFFLWKHG